MSKIDPNKVGSKHSAPKTIVYAVHKAEDGGGYVSAFGVTEYEIDSAVLAKSGKVLSKTEPEIIGISLATLTQKVRVALGI